MSQIYADDTIEELKHRLNRRDAGVFELSVQDRVTREIARVLRISSRDVIQCRQHIAETAMQLRVR